VECPQYSIWLEALCHLCISCLFPAFDEAQCNVTQWSLVIGCLQLNDVSVTAVLSTRVGRRSVFHPNRFTLSGVIAERVNTAKTRRKVNPLFGWSLSSSRIIRHRYIVTWKMRKSVNSFGVFWFWQVHHTHTLRQHTPAFLRHVE